MRLIAIVFSISISVAALVLVVVRVDWSGDTSYSVFFLGLGLVALIGGWSDYFSR
jgi:hypothetical protein